MVDAYACTTTNSRSVLAVCVVAQYVNCTGIEGMQVYKGGYNCKMEIDMYCYHHAFCLTHVNFNSTCVYV